MSGTVCRVAAPRCVLRNKSETRNRYISLALDAGLRASSRLSDYDLDSRSKNFPREPSPIAHRTRRSTPCSTSQNLAVPCRAAQLDSEGCDHKSRYASGDTSSPTHRGRSRRVRYRFVRRRFRMQRAYRPGVLCLLLRWTREIGATERRLLGVI